MNRNWVLLAVKNGKRAKGFQSAWEKMGRNPNELTVLDWRDFLKNPNCLWNALSKPCVFKIETHGEDAFVQDELIQIGWKSFCDHDYQDNFNHHLDKYLNKNLEKPKRIENDFGRLAYSNYSFLGLKTIFQSIIDYLKNRLDIQVINSPQSILDLSDKLFCQNYLKENNVLIPNLLGHISSYSHLRELLAKNQLRQVILKSRFGSCAAGIVAYRCAGFSDNSKVLAITTAKFDSDNRHLYNHKNPQKIETHAEIELLINELAKDQLYAEVWLPKPYLSSEQMAFFKNQQATKSTTKTPKALVNKGQYAIHFDARILTIKGKAAHRLARASSQVMTNLHLDSERLDLDGLLPNETMQNLVNCVENAAKIFPKAQSIGWDLVIHPDPKKPIFFLEANAFGDHLSDCFWQNRNTWEQQIQLFS